jgi:hypothetical protein
MSRWELVQHPYICERMIGFSLPIDGRVAVLSYEGIHIFELGDPSSISHDHDYAEGIPAHQPGEEFPRRGAGYDSEHQRLDYDGRLYPILGLHGGDPLTTSSRGDAIQLTQDRLLVKETSGKDTLSYAYNDLSGDWTVATFTQDASHILLGMPYDLFVFRRTD